MPAPVSWRTVTTRIVVDDVDGLVAFMRDVFDATGDIPDDRPALVMIGDTGS